MNKYDTMVRKAIEASSCHKITAAVIFRARAQWGKAWLDASISQVSQILGVSLQNARTLVSEHCTVKTKI